METDDAFVDALMGLSVLLNKVENAHEHPGQDILEIDDNAVLLFLGLAEFNKKLSHWLKASSTNRPEIASEPSAEELQTRNLLR